ncbi:protein mono-ADP-ribosyltransferase PARP12-like [Ptychodera flava]|uniref:protein mono-ADP-ribosyltransferase PARP12-like n=1 Tax=Ptychodera flava TaxID=63121 RepID=UPI00396A59D5
MAKALMSLFNSTSSSNAVREQQALKELLGYVCNLYDGRVQLATLQGALGPDKCSKLFGGSKPEIFFSKYQGLFQLDKQGGDWVLTLKPTLKLCDAYLGKDGCQNSNCTKLHLCKYFIIGNCAHDGNGGGAATCNRSHDFHISSNGNVLRRHALEQLSVDDLKMVIKKTDPGRFSPQLCLRYSGANGCPRGDKCTYGLHLCADYAAPNRRCAKGKMCGFSHRALDPQPLAILEKYAIDTTRSNAEIMQTISRNINAVDADKQRRQAFPSLCMTYSGKGCQFGQGCTRGLHICRKVAFGETCTYGSRCKFSHNILDPQPKAILERFSIDTTKPQTEILEIIRPHLSKQRYRKDSGDKTDTGLDKQNQVNLAQHDKPEQRQGDSENAHEGKRDHIHARGGRGFRPHGAQSHIGRGGAGPLPGHGRHWEHTNQFGFHGSAEALHRGRGGYHRARGSAGMGFRGTPPQSQHPAPLMPLAPPITPPPLMTEGQRRGRGGRGRGATPRSGGLTRASSSPDLVAEPTEMQTQAGNKKDICLRFLLGKCKKGDRCRDNHFATPYMWQKQSGDDWECFKEDLNKELEQRFCDVTNEKTQISSSKLLVDFQKMLVIDLAMKKTIEIRRLSTKSSLEVKQNKLAVEWIWYWKNDNGWRQYGEQGGEGSSTIRSHEIEQQYQKFKKDGKPLEVPFSVGLNESFVLNFGQMTQTNAATTKKREVRRRPKYLSDSDIDTIKKEITSKPQQSGTAKTSNIPQIQSKMKNWDQTQPDKGGYSLATLSEVGDTSAEYNEVTSRFLETVPDALIVSVERVQNTSLWEFFAKRYFDMKTKSRDANVDVRHLFHGTTEQLVDVICRQNFDWRLSGVRVGTLFGKGSYFAQTAKYSDAYVATDDLYKKMFLTRVLVGEFAQGTPDYVRPPPKKPNDPLGDLYDSCVNNTQDPTIYVVFESSQAYPEYIITYIRQKDMENI